jgi:hypothetical protein
MIRVKSVCVNEVGVFASYTESRVDCSIGGENGADEFIPNEKLIRVAKEDAR